MQVRAASHLPAAGDVGPTPGPASSAGSTASLPARCARAPASSTTSMASSGREGPVRQVADGEHGRLRHGLGRDPRRDALVLLAGAALLHRPACSAPRKRLTGGSLKSQGRVELALSDDLLYWELEGPILRADPRVAWMSGRILSASLLVEGAEVFVFFAAAALEAPGSEGVGMMWSRNLQDWQFHTGGGGGHTSGRRPGEPPPPPQQLAEPDGEWYDTLRTVRDRRPHPRAVRNWAQWRDPFVLKHEPERSAGGGSSAAGATKAAAVSSGDDSLWRWRLRNPAAGLRAWTDRPRIDPTRRRRRTTCTWRRRARTCTRSGGRAWGWRRRRRRTGRGSCGRRRSSRCWRPRRARRTLGVERRKIRGRRACSSPSTVRTSSGATTCGTCSSPWARRIATRGGSRGAPRRRWGATSSTTSPGELGSPTGGRHPPSPRESAPNCFGVTLGTDSAERNTRTLTPEQSAGPPSARSCRWGRPVGRPRWCRWTSSAPSSPP